MMFGYTGLMSLGPVLYFASEPTVFDIALTHWRGRSSRPLLLTLASSGTRGRARRACPASARHRLRMVTRLRPAFYFLVESNPHNLTAAIRDLLHVHSTALVPLGGRVEHEKPLLDRPSRSSSWRA